MSFQTLIEGSGKFLWPADDLDISFKSPWLADRDAVVVVGSFCSKVASRDLGSWFVLQMSDSLDSADILFTVRMLVASMSLAMLTRSARRHPATTRIALRI